MSTPPTLHDVTPAHLQDESTCSRCGHFTILCECESGPEGQSAYAPELVLAHSIAEEAARSEIESFCLPERGLLPIDARWWNTKSVDPDQQLSVEMAVAYLELRGLLERYPNARHLVRILDKPDLQNDGAPFLSLALLAIGKEIHANKVAHGWKITAPDDWSNQHEVPAVLMLVTTEVAEAMEAFRRDDRENFAEELADILIRTVGLAHGLEIDFGQAIADKIARNRTRPFRHGGKRL